MTEKTLCFLTSPERGVYFINIKDNIGFRQVQISKETVRSLAREAVPLALEVEERKPL